MLNPALVRLKYHIEIFEQLASMLESSGCALEPSYSEANDDIYLVERVDDFIELELVLQLPRDATDELDDRNIEALPLSVILTFRNLEYVDDRVELRFSMLDETGVWTVVRNSMASFSSIDRQTLSQLKAFRAVHKIADFFVEMRREYQKGIKPESLSAFFLV